MVLQDCSVKRSPCNCCFAAPACLHGALKTPNHEPGARDSLPIIHHLTPHHQNPEAGFSRACLYYMSLLAHLACHYNRHHQNNLQSSPLF